MEITKEAAKFILALMLDGELDPTNWSFVANVDHNKQQMFISFTKDTFNLKNFFGLNVVMSDHLAGITIDFGKNEDGLTGIVFRNY